MVIHSIRKNEAARAAALAEKLWPGHAPGVLRTELEELLKTDRSAVFLAEVDGQAAGFAQCQLRVDYVEGSVSSPVGYLEGIYVQPPFRGRGIARALLLACEDWAREQGCAEFASDCAIDNTESRRFHEGTGFAEAGRIVCFIKPL